LEGKPKYNHPDCSLATASSGTAAMLTGRASSMNRPWTGGFTIFVPVLLETITKTCDQEQGTTQNSGAQKLQ